MRPYNARAFERFQVPFGCDQSRRMSRWPMHASLAYPSKSAFDPVWFPHTAAEAYLIDVCHRDAGAEGLTGYCVGNDHTRLNDEPYSVEAF